VSEPAPTSTPTWSVRELSDAIAERLRAAFPTDVWVRGEIHDLSRPPSGHVYFTLVDSGGGDEDDDDAGVRRRNDECRLSVMLNSTDRARVNRLLLKAGGRVRMTDGTEVRIRGKLDYYGRRGQLQLRMVSIDPAFTLGQLAAARAALVERLRVEGILDANRRIDMPRLPLRIGLVTSVGSAAEADLLDELGRSGFAFHVRVADVRVQGDEAPASVAGAITWFASRSVDVVVVVRGGGAATDLAAFDHELVARAIAASPHPVVTGVGHEVDRSVADEVAHTSAKTPTAAAQLLIGLVADVHGRAESCHRALVEAADRRVRVAGQHLDRLAARASTAASSATRAELARIDALRSRLAPAARRHVLRSDEVLGTRGRRLRSAARRRLDEADRRLDLLGARAELGDPRRAMARGWSVTRTVDGTVVRSVADVEAGTTLFTTVADGTVRSVVDDDGDQP
jgi:exodeoxyribonuclease VII large subunit